MPLSPSLSPPNNCKSVTLTLALSSPPSQIPFQEKGREGKMSKRGGVGAWALDAEQAEAEERERAAVESAAAITTLLAGDPSQSFPSIKEAASAKPKKKKAVPISLAEFTTGDYHGRGGARRFDSDSKGLTHDEMLRLPTGPKERSAEELENTRLGGGFRSYGYAAGGARGDGSWSGGGGGGGGRRPYGGGFDEEQRRDPLPAKVSDMDVPSRADEVDNWAAGKKSFSSPMDSGPGRHDRYESLGSGSSSKADEVDNWSQGKKSVPSRYSGFGSGFRDSPGLSDSDRWIGGRGGLMPNNGDRERSRLVLAPPKGEVGTLPTEPARTRPSPFGAARPREEVLAEKGLDWKKMDSEIEFKKTSRPTSSQSSRPSSAQSSSTGSPGSQVAAAAFGEGVPKSRQKVNPFGDARPREVLLEEHGMDWRMIDQELEHHRVDRPVTDGEKQLKEKINHLKNSSSKESEGNQNGDSAPNSAEQLTSLCEQILQREEDLDKLIGELDDKVQFGQRATSDMRSGSGAGRIAVSSDRLPSQPGMPEESRSMEFMDRPRSHGGIRDSWARPMDERRGFQGGREMGFLGSRNMDNRSKSRERW